MSALSSRTLLVVGSITTVAVISAAFLLARKRRRQTALALLDEASDINMFLENASKSTSISSTQVIPKPYIPSAEVEDNAATIRSIFEGRYDAALNDAVFQRSCRRLFDRFALGRFPPDFDHPMEKELWGTMINHLVAVADGIHDPAYNPKARPDENDYDLYADIGILFATAALLGLRPAFSLPVFWPEEQFRNIKMHVKSAHLEKIPPATLRWIYWFKLALASPQPKDRWFALYALYLFRFGRKDDAEAILKRALKLKMLNSSRYYAAFCSLLGRNSDAIDILDRLLESFPDDIPTQALQRKLKAGQTVSDIGPFLFIAVSS